MPVQTRSQTRSQTALTKATIPQEPLPRNAKGYPSVGGLTIQKKNRQFGTIHSYGKGKMIDSYGCVYEGDWINDLKHGKGKITYTHGSCYEGEWKNNFKHGKGVLTNTNGSCYEGEWKNDFKHGKGKMIDSYGRVYEGDWFNNKLISIDRIGTTKDFVMPPLSLQK